MSTRVNHRHSSSGYKTFTEHITLYVLGAQFFSSSAASLAMLEICFADKIGMKVILLEEVKNLGKADEVKEVADGYARNFLIPRGLVVFATQKKLLELKRKLEAEAKRVQAELKKIKELAKKLSGFKLEIPSKARKSGKLFGSITLSKIAKLLQKAGFEIEKEQIALKKPIKEAGKHDVIINLGHDVKEKIKVVVSTESQKAQTKKPKPKPKKLKTKSSPKSK